MIRGLQGDFRGEATKTPEHVYWGEAGAGAGAGAAFSAFRVPECDMAMAMPASSIAFFCECLPPQLPVGLSKLLVVWLLLAFARLTHKLSPLSHSRRILNW